LVAGEWQARWNHALEEVATLENRITALGERPAPLSEQQKSELTALGDDGMALWNHPEAPVQLKKRILRTVLSEVVVESKPESPTHRVLLHWVGGVHTELQVERNRSGQHRRSADRTVIELVSELAKVCPDRVINQKDLGLPEVQLQVQAVRTGRLKGGVVCRSVPAGRCEGV
jgi:hypothetical protein